MLTSARLTAEYQEFFDSVLGLSARSTSAHTVAIELPHGVCATARHLGPARPDLLRVSAAFRPAADPGRVAAGIASANREVVGARLSRSADGEAVVCAVDLIVAPAGEMPTLSHLSATVPRALTMLIDGVASFADTLDADRDVQENHHV